MYIIGQGQEGTGLVITMSYALRELTDMSYLQHSYQGENCYRASGGRMGCSSSLPFHPLSFFSSSSSLFILSFLSIDYLSLFSFHPLSFPLLFSSLFLLLFLFILVYSLLAWFLLSRFPGILIVNILSIIHVRLHNILLRIYLYRYII